MQETHFLHILVVIFPQSRDAEQDYRGTSMNASQEALGVGHRGPEFSDLPFLEIQFFPAFLPQAPGPMSSVGFLSPMAAFSLLKIPDAPPQDPRRPSSGPSGPRLTVRPALPSALPSSPAQATWLPGGQDLALAPALPTQKS